MLSSLSQLGNLFLGINLSNNGDLVCIDEFDGYSRLVKVGSGCENGAKIDIGAGLSAEEGCKVVEKKDIVP